MFRIISNFDHDNIAIFRGINDGENFSMMSTIDPQINPDTEPQAYDIQDTIELMGDDNMFMILDMLMLISYLRETRTVIVDDAVFDLIQDTASKYANLKATGEL